LPANLNAAKGRARRGRTPARARSAAKKARGQYAREAIEAKNAARIDKNAARQAERVKARELKAHAKGRRTEGRGAVD
jgi:hypothetical protein